MKRFRLTTGAGVVIAGDDLYVVGGWNGRNFVNTLHRFNFDEGIWLLDDGSSDLPPVQLKTDQ